MIPCAAERHQVDQVMKTRMVMEIDQVNSKETTPNTKSAPPTVFVETTVPSAFVSTRTDPGSLFRRQVTRDWWSFHRSSYAIYTSDAVYLELSEGSWQGKKDAFKLIEDIPRLEINDEVKSVAGLYVSERLVPRGLGGDALHLATCSVHGVDFLLTWNIKHLANPNKQDHLANINRRIGLLPPRIVTPEMLWEDVR